METKKWHAYIILCADKTYYTGITNNLIKRIRAHNTGKGAKYTRGRTPVKLIYSEKVENESRARKREFEIKTLTRKEKEKLIKPPSTQSPLSSS